MVLSQCFPGKIMIVSQHQYNLGRCQQLQLGVGLKCSVMVKISHTPSNMKKIFAHPWTHEQFSPLPQCTVMHIWILITQKVFMDPPMKLKNLSGPLNSPKYFMAPLCQPPPLNRNYWQLPYNDKLWWLMRHAGLFQFTHIPPF